MLPNQITKLFVVLISLVLCMPLLHGQSTNVDSLLKRVHPTNPDSINGQIYYDLARNNYANDTKNALQWAKLGTKYFSKTEHTHLMTRCMNLEAVCLFILDRHEESISRHYEILKIREEKKDTLGIAETLLNIGNVYYRGQDKEQAIKFYHKSRDYALKYNNIKLLSSLNNNLGNYYKDKYLETGKDKDKNAAIKHLKEAILYKEKLSTDRTLEKTYCILAGVYFEAKDYTKALHFAEKANELALHYKNDEAVGSSKMYISKIALAQKDPELAEKTLDDLYSYIANNKAFHILNMYDEEMVILRDKIRNLRSNTQEIVDSVQETNYNSLLLSRQKIREELNIKYETEKKELENANLSLKNKIAQDKAEKNKLISIISSVFALALLFLILNLIKKNKAISKSEQSIKQQAAQLYEQNNMLKQSEAFKAKLFSIISHDLKSPINSLNLIVQMSTEQQLTLENYAYLMSNVKQELDITSNLLNDLLFWSKAQMKSNSIKWEDFDLNTITDKCITTLSSSIRVKQLHVRNNLPKEFIITGDEMRCEFVIRNILHNAIKYSEFYQEIEIGAHDKDIVWDFYIKDNGVGISDDHLQKMFLHDQSRKSTKGTLNEQGAGIGLLLCYDFIESLGWSLEVESEIGVGTTFHIYIKKSKVQNSVNENKTGNKTAYQLN